MPLIDRLFKETGYKVQDLEAVAVSKGPGSFTGLRIGVSTARALAQALNIPAVGVCTLSALAEAVPAPESLICPVLDARRSQVYTALFKRAAFFPHALETMLAPKAMAVAELIKALESGNFDQGKKSPGSLESARPLSNKASFKTWPVIFTGEGLNSYEEEIKAALPGRAVITTTALRVCRASLVALKGRQLLIKNPEDSYLELLPSYLRRPEAERKNVPDEGGLKP